MQTSPPQYPPRQSPVDTRDPSSIIPTGPKGWSAGRTAAPVSLGSYKQGPMSIPTVSSSTIEMTTTLSTSSTATVSTNQPSQGLALAKQQQAILQKAIQAKEAQLRADESSDSPDIPNAMQIDPAAVPTGPRRVSGFSQMGEDAKQKAAAGAAKAAVIAAKLEQAALVRWLPKGKYTPPAAVGIDTETDIARQRAHRINTLLPEHLRLAKTSRGVLADLANYLGEAEAAKERTKSSLESA